MRRINSKWVIKSLVLTSLLFILSGCWDYRISLPNSYTLVRVNAAEILISNHKRSLVIYPNIDKYQIYDNYIVGHVSIPDLPPSHTGDSKPGYFIINTQTHKIYEGLEKQEWVHLLHELNITTSEKLHRPSRFDWIYHIF